MLSSNLAKTSASFLAGANSTFLNKVLGTTTKQARQFSVAFNIKSKFENAYEQKQSQKKDQATKMYV